MGRISSLVRRRQRLTISGASALLALVASPVLAVIFGVRDGDAVTPGLITFALWAGLGWLVLWLGFHFEARMKNVAATVIILGLVLLMVAASRVSPVAVYGGLFGFTVAWFPHCWPVVGTRSSE